MTGPPNTGRRNHWVARADPPFAKWVVTFPSPVESQGIDRLIQFAEDVIDAGEREAVFRVLETPDPIRFVAGAGPSYPELLRRAHLDTGRFPLFEMGIGVVATADGRLRTPSRIAFFDRGGSLVEAEVEDVGQLLAQLRPAEAAWGHRFMDRVAPVSLFGRSVGQSTAEGIRAGTQRIVLQLGTDIWFPWVLGLLEAEQWFEPGSPVWFDNRELAEVHTPRLNRFFAAVRRSADGLDGTWSIAPSEETAEHYRTMVTSDGIALGD